MAAYCAVCGFPDGGAFRCPACGHSGAQPPALPPEFVAPPADDAADTPHDLLDALNFFRSGNYAYYVPNCLNRMGSVSMPQTHPDGQFWTLVLESRTYRVVSLRVGLDPARQTVCLEAPLVQIPPESAVPVFRAALELNAQLARGARLSLRHQNLVLRSFCPIRVLRPIKLIEYVGAFADLSKDLELYFVTRYECRPDPPLTVSANVNARMPGGYTPPPRRPPVGVSFEP